MYQNILLFHLLHPILFPAPVPLRQWGIPSLFLEPPVHSTPLTECKLIDYTEYILKCGIRTMEIFMDIFDIIGPIMIGPSSSHTAGAVRIGYVTRILLTEQAVKADIYLHGSFAHTYKGHGTDRALAAGLMGMLPDDERIRDSLSLAEKQSLAINFQTINIPDAHPNTALLEVTGISGKKLSVQGSSVGGGNILITKINGKTVEVTGKTPILLVEYSDIPGQAAAITSVIARYGLNISRMNIERDHKGGTASMCVQLDGLSIDTGIEKDILKLAHVYGAILVQPI